MFALSSADQLLQSGPSAPRFSVCVSYVMEVSAKCLAVLDTIEWLAFLLGHCHFKGHLFKLGLTDDATCERCLQEDESATHILCDCEAIAHLDFVTWASSLWNQVTFMTPRYLGSYISSGV
jgi:hypothetical protein